MEIVNILIAGVGGQGLVLTTDLIAQAAFLEGYEVATNDVIGLSQRGGMINGSIRFGKVVPTPNVPSGSASVLLGLEKLETLRFVDEVMPGGLVLMNLKEIYPNPVLMEKEKYPSDIEEQILERGVRLFAINSEAEARKLGNIKVANTILIGALSTVVEISEENFIKAIEQKVPPKTVQANLAAFAYGRRYMGATAEDHLAKAAKKLPEAFQPEEDLTQKEAHPMDPAGYEIMPAAALTTAPEDATPMNTEMMTWVCSVCGYLYDPVSGDPDHAVAPGTLWEDVPGDWTCPLCGVGKDQFEANA